MNIRTPLLLSRWLLSVSTLFSLVATATASTVTQATTLGSIRGTIIEHSAIQVKVFYGIPYAKPPVGELRFKAPEPLAGWTGTRDATILPSACWQPIDTKFDRFPMVEMWNANTNMSEDCLYLNMWVPDTADPKAVMVWIYGGAFNAGSSSLDVYNGLAMAARNNVIVVTFNYRLGPFGFLYCGNPDCPGNVGLLDQVLALKFVKENAEKLGGNPQLITIYGESAGAISVGMHLMSPLSWDLFTYAMLMSGAPQVYYATQTTEKALSRTRQLACDRDCSDRDINDVVYDLRSMSAQHLEARQWQVRGEAIIDLLFSPVVDGSFLLKHPLQLMAYGKVKNTTIMTGVVKDEGTYFLIYRFPQMFANRDPNPITSHQYATVVDKLLGSTFSTDYMKHLTMNEYYDSELPGSRGSYVDAVDDIYGDTTFKCSVVDFAQFYSTQVKGRVFMYSYEHRASTNTWPQWMGVPHGYELDIFFGQPWLEKGSNYTDSERTFSDDITKRTASFAKHG
ncbi:unnamed protein product, partial [Candidula unifasciata]